MAVPRTCHFGRNCLGGYPLTDAVIRPALPTDATAISSLYQRVWDEQIGVFTERLLQARQPSPEVVAGWLSEMDFFVFSSEGEVIGVVGLEELHGTAHLVRMVVLKEYRGKGIGRRLVDHVEAEARQRSLSKVWLDTSTQLPDSMAFYARIGYRKVGIHEQHYWGESIVLYEKLL